VKGLKQAILFLLDAQIVPSPALVASCIAAVASIKSSRYVRVLVKLAMQYSNSGELEWHPKLVHDALHFAITHGALDIVDLLLEAGVTLDSEAINSALLTGDFQPFNRMLKPGLRRSSMFSLKLKVGIIQRNRPYLIGLKNHPQILQDFLATEGDRQVNDCAECTLAWEDIDALKFFFNYDMEAIAIG
jgi:hypothetical protein